jgi:hypothetical protein
MVLIQLDEEMSSVSHSIISGAVAQSCVLYYMHIYIYARNFRVARGMCPLQSNPSEVMDSGASSLYI